MDPRVNSLQFFKQIAAGQLHSTLFLLCFAFCVTYAIYLFFKGRYFVHQMHFERDQNRLSRQLQDIYISQVDSSLRGHLDSVVYLLEALKKAVKVPMEQKFIRDIEKSIGQLGNITEKLMDTYGIITKQIEIQKKMFSLELLVEEVLDAKNLMARQRNLGMAHFIDKKIPFYLHGDACRLQQVLNLLLDVGVQFATEGEIRLDVKLLKDDRKQCRLNFNIAVTGLDHTLSPTLLRNIFNQLHIYKNSNFVYDQSISRSILDLALCKNIIGQMGGELKIHSVAKKQILEFDVPLAKVSRAKAGILSGKSSSHSLGNFTLKKMRLLLVDHNHLEREAIRNMVEESGGKVYVTKEGVNLQSYFSALSYRKNHWSGEQFHLILIDGQDTQTVGQFLLQNKNIMKRIVVLISPSQEEQKAQLKKMGIQFFIERPVKKIDIVKTLKYVFQTVVAQERPKGKRWWPLNFSRQGKWLRADEKEMEFKKVVSGQSLTLTPAIPPGEQSIPIPLRTNSVKKQLLLVEDNSLNRQALTLFLQNEGWEVISAESGKQALEILETTQVLLILMDLQLPEINGIACTKMIRARQKKQMLYTPIIALTAFASKEDREKCYRTGMDDYLPKPVSPAHLHEVIGKYVPQ